MCLTGTFSLGLITVGWGRGEDKPPGPNLVAEKV